MNEPSAAPTLPDLLAEGLDIVFVGINPSLYSAARGHYFARPSNRFWSSFSRSALSEAARRGLAVERLAPEHDGALLAYGFGFTDVVKRATAKASELAPGELEAGVPALHEKLAACRPRFACFHGITGYRPFHRVAFPHADPPSLGLQPRTIAGVRLVVVPSPSGANAHVRPAEQTAWYDRVAAWHAEL